MKLTVFFLVLLIFIPGVAGGRNIIPELSFLLFSSDENQSDPAVSNIGGCQILPRDNFWNTPIINYPLHPKSADYIAHIGGNTPLHPDFGDGYRENGELITAYGISYVVVSGDPNRYGEDGIFKKSAIPVSFRWWDESDCFVAESANDKLCKNDTPPSYPCPAERIAAVNDNLEELSKIVEGGSDSHLIVIDADNCNLYEVQKYQWTVSGNTITDVTGSAGAIWNLSKNEQRLNNYTSADAAGLPILPGLVKFDEVVTNFDAVHGHEYGEITHAVRITLSNPQRAYIHPATHSDGNQGGGCAFASDSNCPPMGQKLRLKMSISEINNSSYSDANKVILRALRTYGVVVADTGGDMMISGTHDPRWVSEGINLNELKNLQASDFEAVIKPAGETVYDYSWSSGASHTYYPAD